MIIMFISTGAVYNENLLAEKACQQLKKWKLKDGILHLPCYEMAVQLHNMVTSLQVRVDVYVINVQNLWNTLSPTVRI